MIEVIESGFGWTHNALGPSGAGLWAVGGGDMVQFAWGLTRQELAYLRELLLYHAAS